MMITAPGFGQHGLADVVDVLVLAVEAAGAAIVFAGSVVAFAQFLRVAYRRQGMAPFAPVRLDLGRFLALGLEFQLAADILRTAVAPNFTELAQLAAIAAIRTALNFFLGREIKEQRELVEADQAAAAQQQTSAPEGPLDRGSRGDDARSGGGTARVADPASERHEPDEQA
jgi:uncharacterized membrane protein